MTHDERMAALVTSVCERAGLGPMSTVGWSMRQLEREWARAGGAGPVVEPEDLNHRITEYHGALAASML